MIRADKTNEIKIEAGVPLPVKKTRGPAGISKYRFGEMEIEHSIAPENFKAARMAAYAYAKKHGVKFQTGKDKDGIDRIWRIA